MIISGVVHPIAITGVLVEGCCGRRHLDRDVTGQDAWDVEEAEDVEVFEFVGGEVPRQRCC